VSWRRTASRSSGWRHSSRGVVGTRALVGPSAAAGILRGGRCADDSGCPKGAEEGNVVSMRHQAYAPDLGTRDRTYFTGTRPSLGPSTRARRSSLRSVGASLGGGASTAVSRSGKPARAGGTGTGALWMDVARLAARHRSRKGEAWRVERRKEVEASVPARTGELGFGCPHVNRCCRSR
jgi:hypothetical protein